MNHLERGRIEDYAWGILGGREEREVEAHLAECGECARLAERLRVESKKIGEALVERVPVGLAGRILGETKLSAAPGRRLSPLIGAAAAVLFAAVAAWAWREQAAAKDRVRELEKQLAAAPKPVAETKPEDLVSILDRLVDAEAERNLADLVAAAPELDENENAALRRAVLATTDSTADMLDRWFAGEIDSEMILATDMAAGLDRDLAAALDGAEYRAVSEKLQRSSREAASGAARSLVRDLQDAAGLDTAQAAALETWLTDQCAWRRDLPFFPEAARKALVARHVAGGGILKKDVKALLNDQQAVKVLAYMSRADEARKKMWEDLRKKS